MIRGLSEKTAYFITERDDREISGKAGKRRDALRLGRLLFTSERISLQIWLKKATHTWGKTEK